MFIDDSSANSITETRENTMIRTTIAIIILIAVGFVVAPRIGAIELTPPGTTTVDSHPDDPAYFPRDMTPSLDGVHTIRGERDEYGNYDWRYERR